jgi:tRNA nucleotidyltransferase (CCA-adding enzyme)
MEEWTKLLLRGRKPSLGLAFLKDCGWTKFYPELHAMIGVPQDPEWHPEGDVWNHTCACLDAFAEIRVGDRDEDLIIGLAVLLHDIGKATTTKKEAKDDRWHAYGHEEESFNLAPRFLAQVTQEEADRSRAPARPLAWPALLPAQGRCRRRRRAPSRQQGRPHRPPLSRRPRRPPGPRRGQHAWSVPAWRMARRTRRRPAGRLDRPKKIVLGRHLIAMGHKPAGWFSRSSTKPSKPSSTASSATKPAASPWSKERMAKGVV